MWWQSPIWLLGIFLIPLILRQCGMSFGWVPFITKMGLKNDRSSNYATGSTTRGDQSGWLPLLTWLRVSAVVAAVMALAGTFLFLPNWNRQLIILVDTSESITRSQIERARTLSLAAVRQLNRDDRAAVVAFAGDCRLLVPFSAPDQAVNQLENIDIDSSQPRQTNLKAALRFCRQLLNGRESNSSIFLCTDGRSTTGGLFKADQIPELLGSGIPVHILPIGSAATPLVTQKLDLPEVVHPGERLLGEWRVMAYQPIAVKAKIRMDGRLINTRKIFLSQGDNQIPLPLYGPTGRSPLTPGVHRVEIEFADSGGVALPAAACAGFIQVAGPARVLLIHHPSSEASLKNSLEIQAIKVTEAAVAVIPEDLTQLSGYSAIILDNVPALDLTDDQQTAVQNYVAGGGGLLVIGGDSSLGRGEYYATGLEDLLPVKTDTRQRFLFNRANILFVLDHSGSMSEMSGKMSKQLLAMQGIANSIQELNSMDEVGILAFDTQPTWVLPFTPVGNRAQIRRALATAGEGGGTDMVTALQEVVREFSSPGPQRRHVIILTDGLTSLGDFQELCRKLRYYQTTVSTIGIGQEINEKLLREIAGWGGGQFYRSQPDQIPTIIKKETVRITRDLIQEGNFTPKPATGAAATAPFLEGIIGKTPPVQGYLITKPKSLGTVYLQVGKGDPLLAGWRYGNGRVFVFTSDSGRRWLSAWSGREIYNKLWSQMIRFIERGTSDRGLRAATRVMGSAAKITVDAIGANLRLRQGLQLTGQTETSLRFGFRETAPGHYETEIPLSNKGPSGLEQFEITEKQGNHWTMGWVWNPPGAETMSLGPNLNFLKEMAAVTNGKLFSRRGTPDGVELIPLPHQAWEPVSLQLFLIILALVLFLLELAVRSTALGQLQAVRILWAGWWAAQKKLIAMLRMLNHPAATESGLENRTTTDAYRYLAERARRAREVSKDE